jgi:hypothetical protein
VWPIYCWCPVPSPVFVQAVQAVEP